MGAAGGRDPEPPVLRKLGEMSARSHEGDLGVGGYIPRNRKTGKLVIIK
jgi:hypothetical protein